jgi:hypothetical protein
MVLNGVYFIDNGVAKVFPSNLVFTSVRVWFSTEHDEPEDSDDDDDDDDDEDDGDGEGDGEDNDDDEEEDEDEDDEDDEDDDDDDEDEDKNEVIKCRISFHEVGFHPRVILKCYYS